MGIFLRFPCESQFLKTTTQSLFSVTLGKPGEAKSGWESGNLDSGWGLDTRSKVTSRKPERGDIQFFISKFTALV